MCVYVHGGREDLKIWWRKLISVAEDNNSLVGTEKPSCMCTEEERIGKYGGGRS